MAGYEGYYASIFYGYVAASDFEVRIEDATDPGRMDMSVFYGNTVYIFEFKGIENSAEESPMEQLFKKQYHQKYPKPGNPLFLIRFPASGKIYGPFEKPHPFQDRP